MAIISYQTNPSHPILLFITVHALLLLLLSPAAAQPPSTDPNYYSPYNTNINSTVGFIIIILVIFLFLLAFFSIYIRNCSGDSSSSNGPLRLSANQTGRSRTAPVGLDVSVIASFPTFDYSAVKSLHIGKGALECAVCLNEFEDDETLRLIPKCDHVFHPDCIDMWLVSHTTCPVCRADLTPQPGDSVRATNLGRIPEAHPAHVDDSVCDDTIIDVAGLRSISSVSPETELMERPLNPAALPPLLPPLNRSRTRRNTSGRPKWVAMLARSNSTGHVAIRQGENVERFTLRLPEDVRLQVISGKLNRTTSSRRGPRAGPGWPTGEGSSSRGRMFGSWAGRSDRWGFSMAPPFFTRGASGRSTKVAAAGGADGGSSVRSSKAGDSVHASTTVSDTNLPPV